MVRSVRPREPNYDGIRFEPLRRKVDGAYHELAGSLKDTYRRFWKFGLSKPWYRWDVRPNEEKTRLQFDLLYGLLNSIYFVALYKVNQITGDVDQDDLDKIPSHPGQSRVARERQNVIRLAELLRIEPKIVANEMKRVIKEQSGIEVEVE